MEENQKKIEEQQRKMAEERLKMIEEQMKIENEKQKLKKKEEKAAKKEQAAILGKGQKSPEINFFPEQTPLSLNYFLVLHKNDVIKCVGPRPSLASSPL